MSVAVAALAGGLTLFNAELSPGEEAITIYGKGIRLFSVPLTLFPVEASPIIPDYSSHDCMSQFQSV